MPSPFPGMDPYLEDPALWPDVHLRLIAQIGDSLAQVIAPHYVVRIEERVIPVGDDDPAIEVLIPDVALHESGQSRLKTASPALTAPTLSAPIVLLDSIREAYIEIRFTRGDRVVTVIELLSPANKVAGSESNRNYLAKRRTLLQSKSHFVEIDLLRAGARPGPVGVKPPDADYQMMVSKVEKRPIGDYWHLRLQDPLLTLPVPLAGDDPPAALDLQAAVSEIYVRARYDLQVNYREPPPPPALAPKDKTWLATMLRKKKLR